MQKTYLKNNPKKSIDNRAKLVHSAVTNVAGGIGTMCFAFVPPQSGC